MHVLDVLACIDPSPAAPFETLAPTYRELYIAWFVFAKREETRARRLAAVAARVVGATGIPPIGAIGQLSQLSFGIVALHRAVKPALALSFPLPPPVSP